MQVTFDTRTATAFELTALAELMNKLASVAPVAIAGAVVQTFHDETVVTLPKNDSPEHTLGNAAPTDIPPAPVSAPVSESPPPVPAAPSATPATGASEVPAAPNDQKLDSAGFPWDARIHTANKAVIGDGTWRKKPGVDMALYAAVQAETKPAAPELPNDAAIGAIPDAPNPVPAAPAAPTLTAQDVLTRCTEIQMADMSKGAALFQAIVGAGVPGGPMAMSAVTDPAVLAACLAAINAVGAA